MWMRLRAKMRMRSQACSFVGRVCRGDGRGRVREEERKRRRDEEAWGGGRKGTRLSSLSSLWVARSRVREYVSVSQEENILSSAVAAGCGKFGDKKKGWKWIGCAPIEDQGWGALVLVLWLGSLTHSLTHSLTQAQAALSHRFVLVVLLLLLRLGAAWRLSATAW